jgi:hypothetical protein
VSLASNGNGRKNGDSPLSESVIEWEDEEADINGEAVKHQVEQYRVLNFGALAGAGTAFLMAVTGIWGDGY